MRVSLNWLKEFVDIDVSAEELAERLTMTGLEVERLDRYDGGLSRVVTGRISNIAPHSESSNLLLCDILAGAATYKVVCGAENIKVGDVVPLALEGAVLSGQTKVTKSLIRDQLSEGVLCSVAELGLGQEKSGVMILPGDLEPGVPLAKALGLEDHIFEIGLTPNRADCLSILGIAREVAAIFDKPMKYPKIEILEDDIPIEELARVEILAPDLCSRYAAKVVRDVVVKESPLWLRTRLLSVGINPVNNVVDITNYVLMEYGQPLHAFDLDLLAGHCIRVERARDGEALTTLDGVSRKLSQDMLMIADGEKGVAIAGIMGGLNSEINPGTKSVLIESAHFDAASVRRTRRCLNISTEASYRFERGVDIENIVTAMDRAASLMGEIACGRAAKGHIDVYPRQHERKTISVSTKRVNELLGTDLERDEIEVLLKRLGIEVSRRDQDLLSVMPPSSRGDLLREIDIVEEVARLNGYDKIPVKLPVAELVGCVRKKERVVAGLCRAILNASGFYEAVTYSFMNEANIALLRIPEVDERRRCVRLLNPLSEDQCVLRTSLLPNLLETARHNLLRQSNNLRIFEIGKIFIDRGRETLPEEKTYLAGFCIGLRYPEGVHFSRQEVDFFDVKGPAEKILGSLGVSDHGIDRDTDCAPYLRKGVAARLTRDGRVLGYLGEIEPSILAGFDIKEKVFMFELSFDDLVENFSGSKSFKSLPRYPAVVRDSAIVVSESVAAGEVLKAAIERGGAILENGLIFDVYKGKQVEKGHKSLALRLTYRAPERTLEDEEVNTIHQKVTKEVLFRFKGKLRE